MPLLLALASLLVSSASRGAEIIGPDQRVRIGKDGAGAPALYQASLAAIGHLRPQGCTVTHIGDGLVVTAAHCFEDQPCEGSKIRWGEHDGAKHKLESRCVELVDDKYTGAEDVALFKVDVAPAVSIPLELSEAPVAHTAVTIISHAESKPLQWSGACQITEAYGARQFAHDCDTRPGSSGAAVLDATRYRIIGIHSGDATPVVGSTIFPTFNFGTFTAKSFLVERSLK